MATVAVEERELLKSISWFDGFVVALANPSFLITALGASVLSLGGWGAVILWTVSVVLGAGHNYIYSETAAMFPKLSGGIAIYAHEAWKKYFSFVGPISAFGYWIGWSVVLSATGVVVGFLVQNEWYPSSATSTSWNHSWQILGQTIYFSFPIALTTLIIVVIWVFNVLGMRPAVWVGYITGALLMIPLAVMMFLPYIDGKWDSANLHNNISATAGSLGVASFTLIIVWLYTMCWSSYGMECCATFAPEYHDTAKDTPKALRVAAIFGVITYGLLPMGAMGTFGDQNIDVSNIYTFMPDTLHILLGSILTSIAVFSLCAGIVLAMNTATADGSRALYGIAQDGMTIKWFGQTQRETRAGERDDARRIAEHRAALHVCIRRVGGDQDPDLLQPRVRDLPRVCDVGLPAAAQGSSQLATADQGQLDLAPDRRRPGGVRPAAAGLGWLELGSGLRQYE